MPCTRAAAPGRAGPRPRCPRRLLSAVILIFLASAGAPCLAETPPGSPPEQVRQLLELTRDPVVTEWLGRQRQQQGEPAASGPPASVSARIIDARLEILRTHMHELGAALPRAPAELAQGFGRLADELGNHGPARVLFLVLGFIALGAGTEWLYRRMTASLLRRTRDMRQVSTSDRLRAFGVAAAVDFGGLAIFAAGSLGAFLAFRWPPLLREIALTYLAAAIALRFVVFLIRLLLAYRVGSPEVEERFRLVPTTQHAARFWSRRIIAFAAWFLLGWASVEALEILGDSLSVRQIAAYALGIGLLAIALETIWSWHMQQAAAVSGRRPERLRAVLLSVCLVLLWGVWVLGFLGVFWLGVLALVLPPAFRATDEVAHRLFAAPDGPPRTDDGRALPEIYLSKGLRALLVVGSVLLVLYSLQFDILETAGRDTLAARLARGGVTAAIILMAADLVWQLAKRAIDRRLSQAPLGPGATREEALRQARLRTLLPIFRHVVFITLAVIAVLMALSALGVEIAPLIAGAGIVGVAVGFGSQTLVRDVISGIFYLLDDAFRVGEYIQSGNFKGTVESIGFRSVRLRHQRGPIYTVPFGQLGAVQNMSRDWVIDKFLVGVTYDTDLEAVRKIVKQIGKELAEDPEFAGSIIEPLKMQGVEQFGEISIQLRMKMMTKPGEQFLIRRRALAMMKTAFEANGIKFAYRVGQPGARDESATAGAGREGLRLVQPGPAS
ncbi:mechanosensitive ion channel family protein [Enterovirga sp. CN4-39]|uniref:mechanosensitive ion channel family protein n=1 Tax=Enterovirga sp. CN4-39 TaxID=3400910 RepID=UPI003BFFB5B5